MIAHETGMADIVDGLGGSYALESLTSEIERRAEDYIRQIDDQGGMVAAIESRWVQGEIEARAYEYQRAIEDKRKIIVGVNEFQVDEARPEGLLRVGEALEQERVAQVVETKRRRDGRRTEETLVALERAARGTENLLPRLLDAVKARATVGEVADRLRGVFGEYRPS